MVTQQDVNRLISRFLRAMDRRIDNKSDQFVTPRDLREGMKVAAKDGRDQAVQHIKGEVGKILDPLGLQYQ
jgi:hypothetical protein